MPGWGKLVAGALIGVAGTVYATNEELRKKLPSGARDLPDAIRRRFENAVQAGREASSDRRAEILRALEEHEAAERARSTVAAPQVEASSATAPPVAAAAIEPDPDNEKNAASSNPDAAVVKEYEDDDATRPLTRVDEP
jgi:hypothetical protein